MPISAFIAGAKWRNNAVIDEAIEIFKKEPSFLPQIHGHFIEVLESLKIKP